MEKCTASFLGDKCSECRQPFEVGQIVSGYIGMTEGSRHLDCIEFYEIVATKAESNVSEDD